MGPSQRPFRPLGARRQRSTGRHWRTVFVDYLYLGSTNSTAFSPTDVMPLTHRAKLAMAVQSTVSLVVMGLAIAPAVNIFT
jgi:hypothetical protein